MTDELSISLLSLTAEIVTSHLSSNHVPASEVPTLIQSVYSALSKLGELPATQVEPLKPAVPVRSSVKPDYLVCLEDGEKLTMLKRYLSRRYDMTPEQYRAKWQLPPDYPMVAPNYAAKRRELAHTIGLGRRKAAIAEPASAPVAAPRPRARKPKPTLVTETVDS